LAAGGSARLLGYGLVLLAAAGPQMASSNLALFTLCGLFALALGTICSTRAANPAACASQTTASGSG
jgi:hypothetical protein